MTTPPDSIARNTAFAFAINMLSAAFTLVLTLFLVRKLGPDAYGVFALSMSVGAIVLVGSNLGISNAAARFVAESRHDRVAVQGVVSDALRLKLLVSGIFSLALAAAAGPIASAYSTPALERPILFLSLAVFGQSLFGFFRFLAEAEGRVSRYLRVTAVESAIETVASIALVLVGFGASGAMAGRAWGYLTAAAFAYVLFARNGSIGPALLARGAGNVRRIARYGSALLVVDGAFVLFTAIDALLIGRIIDVQGVGEFQAPMKLMTFLGLMGTAAASGVAPRLTRDAGPAEARVLDVALRRLMLLQGIFLAPLVVWATPITSLLFGTGYESSAAVLRGIAPYAFLIAISPVTAQSVTYLGEARLRVPIAIGALAINTVFDIVMLPRIGIVAGAYGTDIAYFVYVAAHLWICRRLIGTSVGSLGGTLARVLVAAAATGAVLLAFGTGTVGLPQLVAGGFLGSAAYVGALLVTRALTIAELRGAFAVVGGRVSRHSRA